VAQAQFVWSIWFLWFIWLVWFNQINKTDETNQINETDETNQTDHMNKTGWRTFSTACSPALFMTIRREIARKRVPREADLPEQLANDPFHH